MSVGKVYIVMVRKFADFDIPYNEPVCASLSEEGASRIATERNDSRSEKDLKEEIKYLVVPTKLK
jgi:hypothetical protein